MLLTKYSCHQLEKEKPKTPRKTKLKYEPNQTLTTYNISNRRFTAPFFIIRCKPHPQKFTTYSKKKTFCTRKITET